LLAPVFDFTALSATQAYTDSLPPKVRDAIKKKQVLVGMDREMVNVAKGRPDKKIRERDERGEYEEWMYGTPPQDVLFVRFIGNEVIQVKIMKVDGEKIVRTEREVDLPQTAAAKPAAEAPVARPPTPPLCAGQVSPCQNPAGRKIRQRSGFPAIKLQGNHSRNQTAGRTSELSHLYSGSIPTSFTVSCKGSVQSEGVLRCAQDFTCGLTVGSCLPHARKAAQVAAPPCFASICAALYT